MGGVCSSGTSLIQDTEDAGMRNVPGFAATKPHQINGFSNQKHVLSSPKNHHEEDSSHGKGGIKVYLHTSLDAYMLDILV